MYKEVKRQKVKIRKSFGDLIVSDLIPIMKVYVY